MILRLCAAVRTLPEIRQEPGLVERDRPGPSNDQIATARSMNVKRAETAQYLAAPGLAELAEMVHRFSNT